MPSEALQTAFRNIRKEFYHDLFDPRVLPRISIGLCCTASTPTLPKKIGFINTERIYLESKQAQQDLKRWTANFPLVRRIAKLQRASRI